MVITDAHADPERGDVVGGPGAPRVQRRREVGVPERAADRSSVAWTMEPSAVRMEADTSVTPDGSRLAQPFDPRADESIPRTLHFRSSRYSDKSGAHPG